MTKTELLELIRNGENSGVEFKLDSIDSRALAKELVAFANLRGGRVVFGVDDDGSIRGVIRDKLEEWVMTTCRAKIRPEAIPYYERIRDIEQGKDVVIVQVDPGWKVQHVWHNNHRSYYIRVGSQSREASETELERLFQQRGSFRLEVRGVSGASADVFDFRRLIDYFRRIRSQETPDINNKNAWRNLLLNTEFLTGKGDTTSPTIAGLLLFGTNPNRFLPQAGIDAVAYTGKEKDYAAQERLAIRGPMTALFENKSLGENGLVEQAVEFTRRNTHVSAGLADGVRREERWLYPEEAIREVIVNALVHRDYLLSGTTVELSIYEDRLEVTSPGRLPNGITPQHMLMGCRSSRNQLLKDVMRDYGYLEHMGMGVPRKIVKEMKEHTGTSPDLIEDGELFTVKLWNKPEFLTRITGRNR